jgi:hypothetical protein
VCQLQAQEASILIERWNGVTVRKARSENASLAEGATDGKYRKRRPNTEVNPGEGDQLVAKNRAGLHPYMNYGFINSEETTKVVPAGN